MVRTNVTVVGVKVPLLKLLVVMVYVGQNVQMDNPLGMIGKRVVNLVNHNVARAQQIIKI